VDRDGEADMANVSKSNVEVERVEPVTSIHEKGGFGIILTEAITYSMDGCFHSSYLTSNRAGQSQQHLRCLVLSLQA